MQTSHAARPALGDSVRAASRQVWLAGLGAAVVTRAWAGKEAGTAFRALVREGALVESRAVRFVADRVDASIARLRHARVTLESAVKDYFRKPGQPARAKTARRTAKRTAKRATKR